MPEEPPPPDPAEIAAAVASEFEFSQFNFDLPSTTELDQAIAEINAANEKAQEEMKPSGPQPIMLSDDIGGSARPEDIMPVCRLPSAPSKATYRIK